MLPSPFYAEAPADLGDDRIWASEAARARHGDEPTHPARPGPIGFVHRWVAAAAPPLIGWARRALAR